MSPAAGGGPPLWAGRGWTVLSPSRGLPTMPSLCLAIRPTTKLQASSSNSGQTT